MMLATATKIKRVKYIFATITTQNSYFIVCFSAFCHSKSASRRRPLQSISGIWTSAIRATPHKGHGSKQYCTWDVVLTGMREWRHKLFNCLQLRLCCAPPTRGNPYSGLDTTIGATEALSSELCIVQHKILHVDDWVGNWVTARVVVKKSPLRYGTETDHTR